MAAVTLTTSVSRRTILRTATVPLIGVPAALPALPSSHPDIDLLQCIAQAERLRSVHAQARRLRNRLYDVMLADPGYPRLPWVGQSVRDKLQKVEERSGYHAADERCWDLFRQYAEATRAAVAVPAHTPDGIHAKLSLGLTAARRGRARVFEYGDYEWLMFALADLDRLAARGAS